MKQVEFEDQLRELRNQKGAELNAIQKMQGEVKEQISAIDRKIKDLRAEREKLNQQRLIISNHRYEKEREWGEKIRKFMDENFQRTRELENISEWTIIKELRKRGYKGTLENPDKTAEFLQTLNLNLNRDDATLPED
jgi:archaellum component FlaC